MQLSGKVLVAQGGGPTATKIMPDEFINKAGNHVTDAFKFYVRPLLGSGLQSPAMLRAPRVPKSAEVISW